MKASDDRLLRVIAVFKFFKGTALVALSLGAFRILHKDVGETLDHWVRALRLDPGNRYIDLALARASDLRPEQIRALGLGGLVYAVLFFIEGTGLWLRKPWGEWVTTILTGTLIPVEIYEIYRRPSIVKVVVLLINIAVVVYLIWRIRSRRHAA
jgi:uncharacterized membrane protein (DUF2068 family)